VKVYLVQEVTKNYRLTVAAYEDEREAEQHIAELYRAADAVTETVEAAEQGFVGGYERAMTALLDLGGRRSTSSFRVVPIDVQPRGSR
jgi:hypothetical protein